MGGSEFENARFGTHTQLNFGSCVSAFSVQSDSLLPSYEGQGCGRDFCLKPMSLLQREQFEEHGD